MPRKDNKQGGTHPLVLGVPHPELEMTNARTDPSNQLQYLWTQARRSVSIRCQLSHLTLPKQGDCIEQELGLVPPSIYAMIIVNPFQSKGKAHSFPCAPSILFFSARPCPYLLSFCRRLGIRLLHLFLTSVTPVCSTNGNRYGSLAKTFLLNEWTGFSNR
jgi:hypothetical protein